MTNRDTVIDSPECRIGRFTLKPFRQLSDGNLPVSLGRKALELLSVLAMADGSLVTKDELMAAVWPHAIVEDNALQVHVAALRKALGADAELLVTVHGLGYRLARTPAADSPRSTAPPQKAPSVPGGRLLGIGAAVLGLVIVAAAGLWFLHDHGAPSPKSGQSRVAVLPFDIRGSAAQTRGFADGLLDEIVGTLSDNQIQVVSRTESQLLRGPAGRQAIDRLGVDLLLDGTVQSDGKTIDVHLYLDDASEHVSVWSGEFRGAAAATAALQASVAAQAADVLYWAKNGRSGKVRLDAATLGAFVAGRESTTGVRNASNQSAEASYRKVVAAAPGFSWGHSGVAVTEAFELLGQPPSATLDALRADAQREARRALALEPHNGEAYLALELALPLLDWKAREALLVQGTAADPSFEPIVMMEGRLLWVVGRGHNALPWLQRAHDANSLHNGENWSLAISLASQGRQAEAHRLLAQMQTQWPDQKSTKDARLWVDVITGATDDALAQLADPAAWPSAMDQASADAWRATLSSLGKDTKTRAAASRQVAAAAKTGSLAPGAAVTQLAMLGDLDGAFAEARLYQPWNPYPPPYLFLPQTAAMRSDARFMALAAKLGLVDYWRSTGHWPDFCSEPGQPYNCRDEAAKYVNSSP